MAPGGDFQSVDEIKIVHAPIVAIVAATAWRPGDTDDWLERCGMAEGWDRVGDYLGWGVDGQYPEGGVADADVVVEAAARCCYWSYNRGRGHAEHIANLREQEHTSTFEHPTFTLAIAGVSRALTHELVRHRVGVAISQLSQRYCGPEMVRFVLPPAYAASQAAWEVAERLRAAHAGGDAEEWDAAVSSAAEFLGMGRAEGVLRATVEVYRRASPFGRWLDSCQAALASYAAILAELRDDRPEAKRKEVYEAARAVLPNSTESRLFWTINGQAARHFLRKRGAPSADAEIRRLAVTIAPLLKAEAPELFADFRIEVDEAAGTVVVEEFED